MRQDKFLIAILGVIAALVVVALGLFFLRQGQQTYLNQDTPSGVVHDYILALQKGDFQRAYNYLYDAADKPTLFAFKGTFANNQLEISTSSAQVGDEQITGDLAEVNVILTQNQTDLFSSPYQNNQPAELTRQNGTWKIQMVPYPYWGYDWYLISMPNGKVAPAVPVPPAATETPTSSLASPTPTP
jgi:hypothetical protein